MPEMKTLTVNGVKYDLRDASAAPAGYGSGTKQQTLETFAELDTVKLPGKYFINAGAEGMITVDDYGIGYANVDVCGISDGYMIQRMNPYKTGYWLQRNISVDGIIGSWEWFNPPMLNGVEYRTMELYNGLPVYAKLIGCGALPNATYKDVSIGATMTNVVSLEVIATDANNDWRYQLPYFSATGVMRCHACIVGYSVRIYAVNYDMSTYTGLALVKYTKD